MSGMASEENVVQEIARAQTWDSRVSLIRRIPDRFGIARQGSIYAAVADSLYAPHLTPEFMYVHWRSDYELDAFEGCMRWWFGEHEHLLT